MRLREDVMYLVLAGVCFVLAILLALLMIGLGAL